MKSKFYRMAYGIVTIIFMGTAVATAQSLWEIDHKAAGGYFARMWRTAACESAKNLQCPSIQRNQKGELVLMFTHKPPYDPHPVLAVSYSQDEGKTWSDARTVYRGRSGTPKAMGTMTRLWAGRLVAPFVEAGAIRLVTSEDDGQSWQASDPIDTAPLEDASPYGRLVRTTRGMLMPIFGKRSIDGKATSCSGTLRSTDGGKTWGHFTQIAGDGKTDFGPLAIHSTPNRQLLALVSAGRRFIYRSVSNDGGQSWSKPEQRLLACNPALASVGPTLACVDQDTQDRGVIRVQFSDNLFDSWRCDRMMDQDISGQFISAIGLDDDRLLLVHDRGKSKNRNRGTQATKGIEVAMMQRNPLAPRDTPPLLPPEKRDQWVYDGVLRTSMPYFGGINISPDGSLYMIDWIKNKVLISHDMMKTFSPVADWPGGHMLILKSGRWIRMQGKWHTETRSWKGKATGYTDDDGYYYEKLTEVKGTNDQYGAWSDDEGKTWLGGEKIDITPLLWVAATPPFEDTDGTLIYPAFGCFNHEQTASRIDSAGLFRSTDGGKTWGDFSLIGSDAEGMQIAYNETAIQPMPDGSWTAVMRTEWRNHDGGEAASSSVSFTTDRGRTWTKPEFAFIGAVPETAVLPDGALLVATSFNKWRLSYDGGRTWSRELPSHTRHYPAVRLLTPDQLLFYDAGHVQGPAGHLYRRVPASG